jgi:hypothetical protein
MKCRSFGPDSGVTSFFRLPTLRPPRISRDSTVLSFSFALFLISDDPIQS